ncbi:unnamed protein product [Phyllotreta striolata]|uniref:Uncharacterized protein n=1 Tax=Phyllotreta striolata TaxID=444603 RepID=A0A9N9TLZ9_PHYSR|nr:unnamed protein product [Phyllotreta striolata]
MTEMTKTAETPNGCLEVSDAPKKKMTLISRGFLRFSIFFSGYILFLILGASVFSAIEAPEETEQVNSLRTLRSDFLKQNPQVRGTQASK